MATPSHQSAPTRRLLRYMRRCGCFTRRIRERIDERATTLLHPVPLCDQKQISPLAFLLPIRHPYRKATEPPRGPCRRDQTPDAATNETNLGRYLFKISCYAHHRRALPPLFFCSTRFAGVTRVLGSSRQKRKQEAAGHRSRRARRQPAGTFRSNNLGGESIASGKWGGSAAQDGWVGGCADWWNEGD